MCLLYQGRTFQGFHAWRALNESHKRRNTGLYLFFLIFVFITMCFAFPFCLINVKESTRSEWAPLETSKLGNFMCHNSWSSDNVHETGTGQSSRVHIILINFQFFWQNIEHMFISLWFTCMKSSVLPLRDVINLFISGKQ